MEETRTRYQPALRMLGEYLDQRPVHYAGIIEIADGFVVQYQPDPADPVRVALPFSRLDLDSLSTDLDFTRRHRAATSSNGASGWYGDVLRSVGYELDQRVNQNVLIDEHDEGMLVTYLHFHPRGNYIPEKYIYSASLRELDTMLMDAYDRRRPAYHTGNLLKHPVPPARHERPHAPSIEPDALWDVGERIAHSGSATNSWLGESERGAAEYMI